MEALANLSEQLEELKRSLNDASSAEFLQKQAELIRTLHELGVGGRALALGDTAPDFSLPDQVGAHVRLSDLLRMGSVVLSFFRGAWCPYCETELRALHMALPEIQRRGARLIAVSPQSLDRSMSMAERLLLDYSILEDGGNEVAKQFGLAFEIPEEFQQYHDENMAKISDYNGDLSYLLPVPATYVIDPAGIVRFAYVDADYTHRAEPSDVIEVLDGISDHTYE